MKPVDPARYRRIEALHDAVAELDAEQREDYLDSLDDAELAEAVRRLFQPSELRPRLERSVALSSAELLANERPTAIGPWRVLGVIGRGGMGAVYLAERADGAFDRRVAIKILRGLPDPESRAQLRREREIVARLDHPQIARLLDGGETDDGQPYLVLEHVDGLRIDEYADRQRLNLQQRLNLFIKVCEAIAYAHRCLVVHRDIKPANVLIDGEGQVKVLDFGIALPLDHDAETGQAFATRDYAAPEQLAGAPTGTGVDVFALGMLLGDLLVGRSAREARLGVPLWQWPALAGTAEARGLLPAALRRRLRGDLTAIVARAIAESPQARYPDVSRLIEDVNAYRDGAPVLARDGGAIYAAGKFFRRHGLRLALLGVLLGLVALSGSRYLITKRRAELEARVVRGVMNVVRDQNAGVDPTRRLVPVGDYVAQMQARADRIGGVPPLVAARLRLFIGLSLANLGDLAGARRGIEQAYVLREQEVGGIDTESARMRAALAQVLLDGNSIAEAERHLAILSGLAQGIYPRDAEDQLEFDALLAQADAVRGKADATDRLVAIWQRARAQFQSEELRVAVHALRAGKALAASGRLEAARAPANEAWRCYERVYGADSVPAQAAFALLGPD